MILKDIVIIDDYQQNRLNRVYDNYKTMYEDPENSTPMIIVDIPIENGPSWKDMFYDPYLMLEAELKNVKNHLLIEDDRVASIRVQTGCGHVSSAFGCDTHVCEKEMSCSVPGIIKNLEDVYNLQKPAKDAGLFKKIIEYTDIYIENLPEGVHIQHPDLQGPLNTANQLRGSDVFYDFYDDPDAVCYLMDIITDYMIEMLPFLKNMISTDKEWFFDYGALWKGTFRNNNCSAQMISPDMYKKYVQPRDIRLMESVGGGRLHYCGNTRGVLDEFLCDNTITGLDYDSGLHDMWEISSSAPKNLVLFQTLAHGSESYKRLISGDWPKKRNLIINTWAGTVEEGKAVLKELKQSIPV